MTTDVFRPIAWDIDIPLVTNRYMLGTMLKVTVGAAALVGALVSLLMAVQGAWSRVGPLLVMFLFGGIGFFALSVLIMLLVFGNRFRAAFTVDANGVRFETRDRTAKIANRGALVLGAVFLYYAIRLMNPPSEAFAMQVFGYSIWYLMALFAFLLIDHWLMPSPVASNALEFVPTG